MSLVPPALAWGFFTTEPPGKPRKAVGEGIIFFFLNLDLLGSTLLGVVSYRVDHACFIKVEKKLFWGEDRGTGWRGK